MKLTIAMSFLAALATTAAANNLRGPSERELKKTDAPITPQGINSGTVYFGPARPTDSPTPDKYEIRCTNQKKILKIWACAGSWIYGINNIECESGGTPQLYKNNALVATAPAPVSVGTCAAADAFVIDSFGTKFNGATGYTAISYNDVNKKFAIAVLSFGNRDTVAAQPLGKGFTNGFSRIIGDKVSGLQLVNTVSNKLTLPNSSNTFAGGNSGSLNSDEFGYCGGSSRINGLSLITARGKDIQADGTLGSEQDYIAGFGIRCVA